MFFTTESARLFIAFCGAFPRPFSRPDHEKNGETAACAGSLRKTVDRVAASPGYCVFLFMHIACATWNVEDVRTKNSNSDFEFGEKTSRIERT